MTSNRLLPIKVEQELLSQFVTTAELAKMTGMHVSTFHKAIKNNRLDAVRVNTGLSRGYKIMIDKADAAKFMKKSGRGVPKELCVKTKKSIQTVAQDLDSRISDLNTKVKKVSSCNNFVTEEEVTAYRAITKPKTVMVKETFISRTKRYGFTLLLALAGKI